MTATTVEPCCSEIEPEYSLAVGIAPVTDTARALDAPAARTMLELPSVT